MNRLVPISATLALAALLAACAQDATAPLEPGSAVFARPGGSTQVPLQVVWSGRANATSDGTHNDFGVAVAGNDQGEANSGGGDTYTKGSCGVGAHTWTGDNQNGWFDTQPTNYKDTNPACLRYLTLTGQGRTSTGALGQRLEGAASDVEVHVHGMTSATAAGVKRRVGMGIQTTAVRDALGCQRLIYDAAAYPGDGVESATVTLVATDATTGARTWRVEGTTASCEVVSSKGGKTSSLGRVTFPFSFTMRELK